MQQSCDRVGARSALFGVLVSLKRWVRGERSKLTSLYSNCISFLPPFTEDLYTVQQRGFGKAISFIGKQFTAPTHVCRL
jgi:hypothetical protein